MDADTAFGFGCSGLVAAIVFGVAACFTDCGHDNKIEALDDRVKAVEQESQRLHEAQRGAAGFQHGVNRLLAAESDSVLGRVIALEEFQAANTVAIDESEER